MNKLCGNFEYEQLADRRNISLSPEIRRVLEDILTTIPHVRMSWSRQIFTVQDKLDILNTNREVIRRRLSSLPRITDWTSEEFLKFYIARTLTFQTGNGKIALVTNFVDKDEPVTTEQKRMVLEQLGFPQPNKKDVSEAVVGSNLSIDLAEFGAGHGYLGPWTPHNIQTPIFLLSPWHLNEDNPNIQPMIDFALGTNESIIVPDFYNAVRLPLEYAEKTNQQIPRCIIRLEDRD